MRITLIRAFLLLSFIALPATQLSAQKFLKNLTKGLTKEKTDSTATDTAVDSTSINWDAIPIYHPQVIIETDDNGQPLLNPDGTQQTRVLFVDQFGNYRSQEAVDAQRKKLKKYIGNIVLKIGGGAAAGALTGLLAGGKKKGAATAIGAGVGAVAGLALSLGDIKRAKAMHKSLKEQDKMMEEYRKSFTNEGVKVDAAANVESIEGLNIDKDAAVSKTASEIKAIVESESFNTPDTGIWDSI